MFHTTLKPATLGIATIALVLLAAPLASAQIVTGDPTLPPLEPDGVYLNPTNVHVLFSGPALDLILERPEHAAILREINERIPQPGPPGEQETFASELRGSAQVCPPGSGVCGSPPIDFLLTGPTVTQVFGKDPADQTGSWDTEMVSLSLTGNVGGNSVQIRESPTQPSLGHTEVQDIGGGQFRIDSFFDVFTELSVDGGATWIPSAVATRVVLRRSGIPEPTSLVLAALGLCGLALVGRRHRD